MEVKVKSKSACVLAAVALGVSPDPGSALYPNRSCGHTVMIEVPDLELYTNFNSRQPASFHCSPVVKPVKYDSQSRTVVGDRVITDVLDECEK